MEDERRTAQDLINEAEVLMAKAIEGDLLTDSDGVELYARALNLLIIAGLLKSNILLN